MGRSFGVLLGAFVLAAAACSGSPDPTEPPASPAPSPAPTVATATLSPAPTSTLCPTPSPYSTAVLPVRAKLAKYDPFLTLAPAPDGSLYVAIPDESGAVLVRLDRAGVPAAGWPVALPQTTQCEFLAAAADGSVRAICDATDIAQASWCCDTVRAFALDPDGRPLRGWPAEIDVATTARVVGNDLVVLSDLPVTDTPAMGSVSSKVQLSRIAPDGGVTSGAKVDMVYDGRVQTWAIGPDGVAYGSSSVWEGEPAPDRIFPIDITVESAREDAWPVTLEGEGSPLAFDDEGRILLLVGARPDPDGPWQDPAPSLVAIDPADPAAPPASRALPIEIGFSVDCGGTALGYAPLSRGGVTIVLDGMTFHAVDGRLRPLPGWPYEASGYLQDWAYPPTGDEEGGLDCSVYANPVLGPDGTLFVPLGAESESTGGTLVAIARSGKVVPGWPVGLRRAGSGFWAVEVGPTGTVFAAAVEREKDGLSATILGIAPDSTVLWRRIVLEP